MAHANAGSCAHGAAREMLIDATHIDHTAHSLFIIEGYFALWGNKIDLLNRVIEMFWNAQRTHIADPTSSTGMDGIANLVLALQHQRVRAQLRSRLCCGQPGRSAAHNQ